MTTSLDPKVDGHRTGWNDIIASLVIIVVSLGFGYLAMGYGIGSARQMGAGYFPLLLSITGAILGGISLVVAVVAPSPTDETFDLRRFLFVCAAFVVFALAIRPAGLLLTIIITTLVASFAHRDAKFVESVALGIGVALAIWLIFVVLLGLPVRVWPGGF
ncbi:tripartite tricarboxylate transporter TctB family protein [Pseudochelatococcus sp. B33]